MRISHANTDDLSLVIQYRGRLIFWWHDLALPPLYQCVSTRLLCAAFLVHQLPILSMTCTFRQDDQQGSRRLLFL